MARKVMNRKELRAQNDAAEANEDAEVEEDEDGEKKPKKKAAKKATVRKSRAKVAKVIRLKAFWGVFNQSMKPVAKFEYADRKAADKKATDLSASAKTPHFVQIIKEAIEA